MKVKIKKLDERAVIPSYAKEGDAGMDLTAIEIQMDSNGKFIQYHTGLAMEIPEGFVGMLYARSSVTKKDLILKNCVGIIDSGYRGEICLRFQVTGANLHGKDIYKVGEKVGQIIIQPIPFIEFEEVLELEESERGEGGFGSTDTNTEPKINSTKS
jgi:dUTP pyrophosphatase